MIGVQVDRDLYIHTQEHSVTQQGQRSYFVNVRDVTLTITGLYLSFQKMNNIDYSSFHICSFEYQVEIFLKLVLLTVSVFNVNARYSFMAYEPVVLVFTSYSF